ncbi:AAA family ATPase [bacterium]|nr:AAA family ATPase [bacterium]
MHALHGRDAELALLVEAWEEARQGQVRYVRIAGEPGLGKTRLVQELYRILTTQYDPAAVESGNGYWPDLFLGARVLDSVRPRFPVEGPPKIPLPFMWWAVVCRQGNEHVPDSFAPFLDAMEQLSLHLDGIMRAKLVKDAWLDAGRSFLEAGLGFTPVGPLVDVYAALRSVWQLGKRQRELKGGRSITELSGGKDIYHGQKPEDMISRLLSTLNDPADNKLPTVPLVLVLDDAQWADARSLGFVQRMLELGVEREWSLLCISTIRSNELASQLRAAEDGENRLAATAAELETGLIRHTGEANVRRIDLTQDLDQAAINSIISDHIPHASDETIQAIASRAGNHPFYAVNYALLVREEGWVDSNGALTVGSDELSRIPAGIRELIDRRLRLLDGNRRRVLEWASVQGQRFLDELIALVSREMDIKPIRASAWLTELTEVHQLVNRQQRQLDWSLYGFTHRLLFERVAEGFGDDNPEHGLVRDCLGELLREYMEEKLLGELPQDEQRSALRWLSDYAADRQKRRREQDTAGWKRTEIESFLLYFSTIPIGNRERMDLADRATRLMKEAGLYRKAHELAAESVKIQRQRQHTDQLDTLESQAEALWQLAREQDPSLPEQSTYLQISRSAVALLDGDLPRAVELAEQAIELAVETEDEPQLAKCDLLLASYLMQLGRLQEAEEILLRLDSEGFSERTNISRTSLLQYLALCNLLQKRDEQGISLLLQALDCARASGDQLHATQITSNIGVYYSKHDDIPQAYEYTQRALHMAEEVGDESSRLFSLCSLGSIDFSEGDYEQACSRLETAYTIAIERNAHLRLMRFFITLMRAQLSIGNYSRAVELAGWFRGLDVDNPGSLAKMDIARIEASLLLHGGSHDAQQASQLERFIGRNDAGDPDILSFCSGLLEECRERMQDPTAVLLQELPGEVQDLQRRIAEQQGNAEGT